MSDTDARLQELSAKAIDGVMTDAEFRELEQLSKAKKQAREDRAQALDSIKSNISRFSIEIGEIYEVDVITAAASRLTRAGKVRTPRGGVKVAKAARATRRRASTDPLVVVKIAGHIGPPSRYSKGQVLPYYVARTLKELDDGRLEENLARYTTATGKAYFATPEGQAEFGRLVAYIQRGKIKPA